MKIISDQIHDTIKLMAGGKIPTRKKVECPVCHKQANISASTSSKGNSYIDMSVWCEYCGMMKEICGYPKWIGWEALEPAPK